MRQARLINDREFAVEEANEPPRVEGEVLVKVSRVGVCGSDLHVYLGHHPKVRAPVVLGHECAGTICWAPEHAGVDVGIPVTFTPLVPCKSCAHCRLQRPNICLNRQVIGFQRPGGLADVVSVPTENVVPLPEGVGMKRGALCEPLAVAVHATSLLNIEAGQPVTITGAGPIGLLVGLYARETYHAKVQFVEINPHRTDFAAGLGFEVACAASEHNVAPRAMRQPMIFECTGRPEVVNAVLDLVPAPAEVVLVGAFERSQTMGLHFMGRYETVVVGSQMYTMEDMVEALETLAGPDGQTYERLVSDRAFPLEQVQEAYEEATAPADGVKVEIALNR